MNHSLLRSQSQLGLARIDSVGRLLRCSFGHFGAKVLKVVVLVPELPVLVLAKQRRSYCWESFGLEHM